MGTLGNIINIRSSSVLRRIVKEVWRSLSVPLRVFAKKIALVDQWSEEKYICPSMIVSPAVGQWREESGRLLSLKTPVLDNFSSCGKKLLSQSCEGVEPPLSG